MGLYDVSTGPVYFRRGSMSVLTFKSSATARWKRATRGGSIPEFSLNTVLPKRFPLSQEKYFTGNRSDLRAPYHEITLSPTHHSRSTEENPPLPGYDSSGPFSDPDCSVDVVEGLPKPGWQLDRRAKRHKSAARPQFGISETACQQSTDVRTMIFFETATALRPSRSQRDADALCADHVLPGGYRRGHEYSSTPTVAVRL
jgi:ThiC-associated domain